MANAFTLKGVTLSFPSLFTAQQFQGQGTAKYSTEMVIKKGSTNEKLVMDHYEECKKEALAAKKLKPSSVTPLIKQPGGKGILLDCDEDPEKYDPKVFGGCWIMRASCTKKPIVIDRYHSPISEADDEIYGGCVADVNVNIYPYNNVVQGITTGLNGVMKTGDGERLGGGRPSVDQMFGAAAESDDLYD